MTEIFIHYVYAYLRPDGSPYYIGKGKNDRAFKKHTIPVPADKTRIIFLETNLSDIGSMALERRYIRWYGRKDNDTGILRNLTDGGEGFYGLKHSAEAKMKMSEYAKNRSAEHKRKIGESNKGRTTSTETKIKISKSLKNRLFSDEHKRKISISKKNMTDETRRKIGEANKRRFFSIETRRKMSESKKKMSIETRRKIGLASKHRIRGLHTIETRRKMSESAKRRIYQKKYDNQVSV